MVLENMLLKYVNSVRSQVFSILFMLALAALSAISGLVALVLTVFIPLNQLFDLVAFDVTSSSIFILMVVVRLSVSVMNFFISTTIKLIQFNESLTTKGDAVLLC